MSELATDFQSLPPEYQNLIRLAQDEHKITIKPLQKLVGGWSGAIVYLVSALKNTAGRVEHYILKLDHKSKTSKSDEVIRHNLALSKSTSDFARAHIAELVFERVEQEGAIAIFYGIAGQSLLMYRPLSNFAQQNQLTAIFTATNTILLTEWNVDLAFEQGIHPQKILDKWLGFRLEAGGNIEHFLQTVCRVNPDVTGFLIGGNVFPNPLHYARQPEAWRKARAIDIATGFLHGDLNTNNILVKFSDNNESLEGYYLIDFALFKEQMPLLYDQRYLEISYLIHSLSQIPFAKCANLLTSMAEVDILSFQDVSIEMAGISEVIASARGAFAAWVKENHPSLHDDLWGQYWLAGVAAGLAYCHKAGQPEEQRLLGLIYAAANLKRYASAFKLPLPTEVDFLYDVNQPDEISSGISKAKKTKHNLPAQVTPFIGRTAQLAAIKELLMRRDVRLVTLIGPGGTGKTRLSLQVAQDVLDHFPEGVYFVPLADDMDAHQFISRMAQQLGVREGSRPLLESIKDYLRDQCMLLVLDNFEQLVPTASIVADLLATAQKLKIITSSRIALQLHSEYEFLVPPLDLPQISGMTLEDLAHNESVILFVERARASSPNFALTDDNAAAIAEICRRLDGLPLALELAAARVKLLPPQAILARLDDRFKLLTGGARDLPARQQTLHNTLEWSYSLLNEEEKTLYARLSVFVGGFTLEAAEALCNWEQGFDILESLTALINNSLLRQEGIVDGEPRFGMLETIRVHALEHLVLRGEMELLRTRHASYFSDVVINQVGFQMYYGKALYWLNWLEREHDNIRATLTWSLTTPQGIELAAELVFALFWFFYRRGYFVEGYMWAEQILAFPQMQTISKHRALVLLTGGMMALWKGEQDTALKQIHESLEIMQRLEDGQWMAHAIMSKAVALINMGQDKAAQPLLEEAQAIFKEQNLIPFHAITLVHLGNVQLGLGNPEQARLLHEKALVEARNIGENWLLSFALNNLGEVARTQGQYDLARKYYEECEALLRETGDQGDMARFVHTLGYIAQHEGDSVRAESQFRKSLAMFRRLGNRRGIAECLAGLAGLKARQGSARWGAIMLGAGESLLHSTGGEWWPADRVEVEQNRAIIKSALPDNEFIEAWETGKAMTIDQSISFASKES